MAGDRLAPSRVGEEVVVSTVRDWQDSVHGDAGPSRFAQPDAVVVLLDGSESSRSALPVARRFAELYEATLHVLTVGPPEDAGRVLEHLRLTPEDVHGAILDRSEHDPQEAISAVVKTCAAPVVTISTHCGSDDPEAIMGQLAESVITEAAAHVLLVPPDRGREPWDVRRVLLAHDGSPSADAAIAPAADVARRAGADVIALHVAARKAPQSVEPGSLPAPRYVDQPQHEWPAWANEFVQRMMTLGASPAAVNFKLLVTGGQPGSEIAQFARDNGADLVIATWRGNWDEEHAGTLKVIVRRSGCPVLLLSGSPQRIT
jgi:nucleotide-binding universal stress UspA family protein